MNINKLFYIPIVKIKVLILVVVENKCLRFVWFYSHYGIFMGIWIPTS